MRSKKDAGLFEQFDGLRADYDAAKRTRFKRKRVGISSTGSGADYHYRSWSEYARIMETARDLFRNHMLIGQGIRRLVSNILRGGFINDPKTGDAALDTDLLARWNDYASDPEQCDITGEQNFHGLEKLVLQQVIVDGDHVTLPTRDGSLQGVESHRMRTPSTTTRNVVHGILLDQYRRRLEYWITKDDIDPMSALKFVRDVKQYKTRYRDSITDREERQVLHHYMPDRTSQTRGITALVPVVDTAGMGDDLMFAQLVKAQMAACVTIIRELQFGVENVPGMRDGMTSTETRPDGTIRQIGNWQPGTEIFGFPGEKITGFSPNVPNAEFFQHANLILSIVAVNLDLPVAVLLLDPSNTNFSGWRGAMDQARQRFMDIQQWLISSFHCHVYRWKVRQWAADDAALRGAIERWLRGRGMTEDVINPFGHVWRAQEWPYIEPVQDAMGDVIQERNLLISPRRRAARRGMDFFEVTDEGAEDREYVVNAYQERADRLNKKHGAKDGWKTLVWSDLAHWPMPEGVQISLDSKQEKPEKSAPPASATYAALSRNGDNGHAN